MILRHTWAAGRSGAPSAWSTFCSYRREDSYKNDNYLSDGLDNAALAWDASELIQVVQRKQYTDEHVDRKITEFKEKVNTILTGNTTDIGIDWQDNFKWQTLHGRTLFG